MTGRSVLVTGAGAAGGIGFATARLFAGQGARVAITATTARIHDRAAELNAEFPDAVATAHQGDLTDPAFVAALAAAVGVVDVLVNNAGMGTTSTPALNVPFLDMAPGDWQRQIDVTLTTAVLVTRAFLPAMVARGWGRVVMVASVTGPLVSNPGDSAYSAAKAGMVGLARTLALEVAAQGVTVNSVAPGWIATGATTAAEAAAARATPTGRAGTPQEVASCIGFLASDGAAYVNGAMLVVDGGNLLQERKG